ELFGVLQQVSGDTRGVVENSIVSAQFPDRGKWLGEFAQSMGRSSKLATIPEIERLWGELQKEMTESSKISRFNTLVITQNGEREEREVVRVGTFNLVSNGEYVTYDTNNRVVTELQRQPAGRFVSSASNLQKATDGFVPFGLDPTRGQLLALQVQVPTIQERIQQGGTPGYVIIALGIIALLLSLERFITLNVMGGKVKKQMSNSTPDNSNPLGRVLSVYHENKDIDSETLQLKLDEAILKEQPGINARIAFIRIISMVAPLLGLLGTVIGMIVTFQAITLFGTGDPKTMAGGISQALITTVLGLTVAIPTVLLHSIVNSRAQNILHILTEQSAGLIAEHAESGAGK
ncbi:MAG: MotA/TolQ/ExbB proton channel family protein, partial [Pseudomonadales bacterium]